MIFSFLGSRILLRLTTPRPWSLFSPSHEVGQDHRTFLLAYIFTPSCHLFWISDYLLTSLHAYSFLYLLMSLCLSILPCSWILCLLTTSFPPTPNPIFLASPRWVSLYLYIKIFYLVGLYRAFFVSACFWILYLPSWKMCNCITWCNRFLFFSLFFFLRVEFVWRAEGLAIRPASILPSWGSKGAFVDSKTSSFFI